MTVTLTRVPVPPVVDELAGEVAGVEERETGVVDVARTAHRRTSQRVADQHETVGDWQRDEELRRGVGAKRRRRDEHTDREDVTRDAYRDNEEQESVEIDVKAGDAYVDWRQFEISGVCCCNRQQLIIKVRCRSV